MGTVTTILLGAIGSLIAAELYAKAPKWAALIVDLTTRWIPGEERAIRNEEMLAELGLEEGNLAKLHMALSFARGALVIGLRARLGLRAGETRSLTFHISKRVFDVVMAIIALPMVVAVALAVALAIKLEDGGPVLSGNPRVGRGGRAFLAWKFRTLPNPRGHMGEAGVERLTLVGSLLRRWMLDDLPQVLNILKGDMSWIGPRPLHPEPLDHHGQHAAIYLRARPGITGMAQVSNATRPEDRVALDRAYVESPSWKTELSIIWKTIRAALCGFASR
jgi:lipopolysaccharide/colanic/teichoic acid biosynthesis glycosyltransferase